MAEPADGKKFVKVVEDEDTGREKTVSYGDRAYRIAPKGTTRADSYCARSAGIKKGLSEEQQNDPNTPNNLSRKKWGCSGDKSVKD
jgi:hypothetical protein